LVNGRWPALQARTAALPHWLPDIDCIGFNWIFAYMKPSNPFA
jgi:hypothetical protein